VRLRLTLAPSVALAALLAVGHLGAFLLLVPLELPTWLKAALAVVLMASLAFHVLRDAWLRLARSVSGIDIAREDAGGLRCEIVLRGGVRLRCRVLPSSVAIPVLVLLNVRPQDSRLSRGIPILPDMLTGEDFRALRVLLRWGWRDAA
jgi:membrane-bound toxin of toxin-antitoxin system